MEFTLTNLCKTLKQAFYLLKMKVGGSKLDNIVIAIGDTGCGKSTLLQAMILGSEKLAETTISFEYTTTRG